jgi:hypothetical protein
MGCPKSKRRRLAVVKGVPVHARRRSYNSYTSIVSVATRYCIKTILCWNFKAIYKG